MMPITYAKTDEQIEEERRLLYVGATRARKHLSLSWALARSPGGRAGRTPTRFLDGLRPGSAPRGGGRAGRTGRGGAEAGAERTGGRRNRGPVKCRVCDRPLTEAVERKLRRCEGCPSAMDEALFERLREWRGEQARSQSLPAYVVFTDATLMAIAEDPPGNERELAAVPGVGPSKLDKYGAAVLSLCAGEQPVPAAQEPTGIDPGGDADAGVEEGLR
jgi:DNA helicase II / ATP-dependent DNA helicase PcrA